MKASISKKKERKYRQNYKHLKKTFFLFQQLSEIQQNVLFKCTVLQVDAFKVKRSMFHFLVISLDV